MLDQLRVGRKNLNVITRPRLSKRQRAAPAWQRRHVDVLFAEVRKDFSLYAVSVGWPRWWSLGDLLTPQLEDVLQVGDAFYADEWPPPRKTPTERPTQPTAEFPVSRIVFAICVSSRLVRRISTYTWMVSPGSASGTIL